MTNQTNQFFAISGIGWGKGESIAEAVGHYYAAQEQTYRPMLSGRTRADRLQHLQRDAPVTQVWEVSEDVVGFNLGGPNGLTWEMADGSYVAATIEQRWDRNPHHDEIWNRADDYSAEVDTREPPFDPGPTR